MQYISFLYLFTDKMKVCYLLSHMYRKNKVRYALNYVYIYNIALQNKLGTATLQQIPFTCCKFLAVWHECASTFLYYSLQKNLPITKKTSTANI